MLLHKAGEAGAPRFGLRAALQRSPPLELTTRGRELAASANPVVLLDDTDKRLLSALIHAPMRQLQLVRRTGLCSLTIKRRLGLMIGRGLVKQDAARQPFVITPKGIAALGPDAAQRPEPWIKISAISAANARDVGTRLQHPNDDRTAAERSRQGSEARKKALATPNQQPFIGAFKEFDRTAG